MVGEILKTDDRILEFDHLLVHLHSGSVRWGAWKNHRLDLDAPVHRLTRIDLAESRESPFDPVPVGALGFTQVHRLDQDFSVEDRT